MTNLDAVKRKINSMNENELIEFCGGDNCDNILCKLISGSDKFCDKEYMLSYPCAECIKTYLTKNI